MIDSDSVKRSMQSLGKLSSIPREPRFGAKKGQDIAEPVKQPAHEVIECSMNLTSPRHHH